MGRRAAAFDGIPEDVEGRRDGVTGAVERAREALLETQRPDGHWCYEFEADCTIPAEYVLFLRYLAPIGYIFFCRF